MKRALKLAAVCAALSLSATSVSLAQVSADGMGKVLPVELFACNFNDGKDMGDLERVNKRWNDWMDENNADYYAAWLLTPYFFEASATDVPSASRRMATICSSENRLLRMARLLVLRR